MASWLREKQRSAEREDYGRDLEDCIALIEESDQMGRELSAAGERVAHIMRAQA